MPIESFRGDYAALAAMIKSAWSLNRQPALLFTEGFLRSAFAYPGSGFDLAPALYDDEGIASFSAAFPRKMLMGETGIRLAVNTFLTVSPRARGAGHVVDLWDAVIGRTRSAGFDGVINFCVEGDRMNEIMPVAGELLRLNTRAVFRVEYLTRFLRPLRGTPAPPAGDSGVDLLLELAAAVPLLTPLRRVWSNAEALWQCRERAGAITSSLQTGPRRGMITGYVMQAMGDPPVSVALMDDIFWGNLDESERSRLLQSFLTAAAGKGAQSVSCPVLGYCSIAPLAAAGFRTSKRVLQAWLTLWNGTEPAPLSSIYTDVF